MKRKRIYEFIVDNETLIKVGNEFVWSLWIAIGLQDKTILGKYIVQKKSI
jgi:transposase-like protein